MSLEKTEDKIILLLKNDRSGTGDNNEWYKAIDIARKLNVEKVKVNQILYSQDGKLFEKDHESNPPIWRLRQKKRIEESKEDVNAYLSQEHEGMIRKVLVCVDLGNIHDVLQKLEHVADGDTIEVCAFADATFNGYGIKPTPKNQHIKVITAISRHRNAADTHMMFEIFKHTHDSKHKNVQWDIYVVTKDNGFQELQIIVEQTNKHTLRFCKDWEELRLHIC